MAYLVLRQSIADKSFGIAECGSDGWGIGKAHQRHVTRSGGSAQQCKVRHRQSITYLSSES